MQRTVSFARRCAIAPTAKPDASAARPTGMPTTHETVDSDRDRQGFLLVFLSHIELPPF